MDGSTNPIAVRTVPFRGHNLETFEQDAQPYVVLKPIVEGMGLDWEAQRQRVKRDAVLSTCAFITQAQVGGQRRDVVALPLRFLNGFLFGIDALRVRRPIQEVVIAYQRECYDVLADYWMKGAAVNPRAGNFDEIVRRGDGILRMLSHKVTEIEGDVAEIKQAVSNIAADKNLTSDAVQDVLDRLAAIGSSGPLAIEAQPGMITAYEVVGMAEVPQSKRYNGLYSYVSKELQKHCGRNGYRTRLVNLMPGERWEFQREGAVEWSEAGGRKAIWEHVNAYADRKKGQGVIKFPRKDQAEVL